MIFNQTKNYQFTTRMTLNDVNVEVVSQTKLLGTHITNDLKWDLNTKEITRKANARMQLLQKAASFNPPKEDLKAIYITFIRSLLEQSCIVTHSMLSQENKSDLERVQMSALKIILKHEYIDYQHALNRLDMISLEERRENLCKHFAHKNVNNAVMKAHFESNLKTHIMKTRNPELYDITFAHTQRLKNSPIIYMQRLLNEDTDNKL